MLRGRGRCARLGMTRGRGVCRRRAEFFRVGVSLGARCDLRVPGGSGDG
jgi:hypothetical protein